jgi:hydrogenase maturation protein HypF
MAGATQPIRRARGFVPDAIGLGGDGPCVLAVGPQWKSTICLTRGAEAYVSQHIGDLDGLEAQAFFEEVVAKLAALLGVRPSVVAHDLHPDYVSTRWAAASGLPAVGVQHHHAHVASCMAEHGRRDPVIGVAFDGTGCGPAGELWGGEFLLADLRRFRRVGHLRPLALAGGEAAIRQPWRVGLAALLDAGETTDLLAHVEAGLREAVARMIARGTDVRRASGAGRWFDAVAALTGVRDAITYEGQAAIELESVAASASDDRAYPYEIAATPEAPFVVDLRPTVRAIVADVRRGAPAADVAARFHSTLSESIADGCRRARSGHGVEVVALSGGCFQNRRLTERVESLLARDGFDVLVHRLVPPNDAGVALGQAAIAHCRLTADHRQEGVRHVPRDPR